MTLTELGVNYKTDKAFYHGFTPFYEIALEHLRLNPMNILEIGVEGGSSLNMWHHYFGYSNIYGFDIEDYTHLNKERMYITVGDQSDRDFLVNTYGKMQFDVIIDDGSHCMDHQQISFGYLFSLLKPGGHYIIEDLHTSEEIPGRSLGFIKHTDSWPMDTTWYQLNNFKKTGEFFSKYIPNVERQYLNKFIDSIELINIPGPKLFGFKNSRTSIIKKKS
jgi:hypothetical protein